MSRPSQALRAGRMPLVALLAAACAPARQAPAPAPFAPPLVVDAPAVRAYAGASIELAARGDEGGLDPRRLSWVATPYHRAWVSGDGTLTFLAPGPVTVRVRDGLREGARTFTVERNRAARVVMRDRVIGDARVGDTVRVVARVYDGEHLPIPDAPVAYALVSRGLAAGDAWVSPDGRFVASAPGIYTVLAECGRVTARTIVIVESEEDRFARALAPAGRGGPPRVQDRADSPADHHPSAAPSADRARRAQALGRVTIAAERTTRVAIDDIDGEAYDGTTLALAARVWVNGQRRPDTTARVVWASRDTAKAYVTQGGRVVFLSPGWVTLTATHGGVTATRRINVRWHPAARLALRPGTPDVRVGQPVKFREEVWQPGGDKVADARVNYAIIAHGAPGPVPATMSEQRVFTAARAGVYTVIAEVGGVSDRFTMLVRESSVAAK